MAYEPRKPKWPWRDFLTEEERNIIRLADGAKIEWKLLNQQRVAIANRALQRAKYAARLPKDPAP